jgi:hypothetical protein
MHHAFARLVAVVLACAALTTTVRADTVYGVSFNNGSLIRFDSANPSASVVTLSGSGVIGSAAGLAFGPDGNLYIGDNGDFATVAPSIKRFNLTTNSLSTVYTFSAFDVFPGALVFKGNDLLVGRNPIAENTGPIVRIANAVSGSATASDYTSGGSLASSPGLALGSDGSLYVSSQTYTGTTGIASGPVEKFDAAGTYIGTVIASGSTTGLSGPTGIAIRGTSLFTASIMDGTILRTNLLDDSTTAFSSPLGPFQASPLALLSDGGLIVGSASGGGAIYRLDSSGALAETFNSPLGTIGGLVVAPVPEPSTIVTAGIGIAAAAALFRRRVARS